LFDPTTVGLPWLPVHPASSLLSLVRLRGIVSKSLSAVLAA